MSSAAIHVEDKGHTRAWKGAVILVLAGLLVYSNSFNKAYVFDDEAYLPGAKRLKSVGEVFNTWGARKVGGLSFWVTDRLGKGQVGWHHAGNVAIHIIAALALFGVVRRTLLLERWRGRFEESATLLATAATLLWMVHPLNTMAVTYLIQRLESLMGMFYLLTVYFFIRGATASHRPWGWYLFSAACCYLGMQTKEVMATCPLMVLIYDWVFLSGSPWRAIRQRWGVYLALFAGWALLVPALLAGIQTDGTVTAGLGVPGVTPVSYFRTQLEVVLYYLRLSFWPSPLVLDYQDWRVARSWTEVLPAAAVTATLIAASAIGVLRRTWWGFLGAWFFGALSVSSSFMPIIDMVFEHRMYLSLASVVVLVVILLDGCSRWAVTRLRWGDAAHRGIFLGCVILMVTGLSLVTVGRNHDFRTPRAIWTDTITKRPANGRAHSNLGGACIGEGAYEEAEELLRKAIELNPRDPVGYTNLGVALDRLGRPEEAVRNYQKAVQLAPGSPMARINLAISLHNQGKIVDALEQFREAVALEPDDARFRANLATALYANNQPEAGDAEYAETLRLAPDWPRTQMEQGWALLLGDTSNRYRLVEALRIARATCQATGFEKPEYLDLLAVALAANGDYPGALDTAQKAQRLAEESGNTDLAKAITRRIELYRQNKPYTHENVVAQQTGTGK